MDTQYILTGIIDSNYALSIAREHFEKSVEKTYVVLEENGTYSVKTAKYLSRTCKIFATFEKTKTPDKNIYSVSEDTAHSFMEVPKDIMLRAKRVSKDRKFTNFFIVKRDDEFEITTAFEEDDELYYTFIDGKFY